MKLNSKLGNYFGIVIVRQTSINKAVSSNNVLTVTIPIPSNNYDLTDFVALRSVTSGFCCAAITHNDTNVSVTLVNTLNAERTLTEFSCYILGVHKNST